MITSEEWALLRRLAAEGEPKAKIAARLGISRTTVIKAAASESPPRYERSASATSFTTFEVRVRELLLETPTMPATVLAERVGWEGSIRWFRDNVARLRPERQRMDPADRLVYASGFSLWATDGLHVLGTVIPARHPSIQESVVSHSRCCFGSPKPTWRFWPHFGFALTPHGRHHQCRHGQVQRQFSIDRERDYPFHRPAPEGRKI